MSNALLNILIGLVTSLLSGVFVWSWQRARQARVLRRKSAFFGIRPGADCLLILNHKWNMAGSTAHSDVHALIEVSSIAAELDAKIELRSCDDVRESNGSRTEFCVGGPHRSNPRTAGHLAAHLPGVTVLPYSDDADSGATVVDGRTYRFDRGRAEYALIAKFTPAGSTRPVFVISGQSSIGNRAAVHFLKRDYRQLTRSLGSVDRFCLVVRVEASDVYGHEMVALERDVTTAAFRRTPAPRPSTPDPQRTAGT